VRHSAWRFTARIRIAAAAGAALATALVGFVASPAVAAQAPTASPVQATSGPDHALATGPFGPDQKAQPKTILLLNGDRMIIDGKSTDFELAGGGFAAAVTELRLAGREYAVPDVALPFLGHGLDLSLFDIAALPGGGTLSLRITYSGAVPRLPGVTITRAAGGVATGYLTAAGAVTFGAALARQFAADHRAASYGTDGLFGGGVWISAAGRATGGASAPSAGRTPTSPRFPMHTVTVRGLTAAGKPDTGDLVFLYDATNNAIYGDPYEDPSAFYHGSAKFSVPDGKYWALAWFTTVDKKGNPTSLRTVLEPRIIINGNSTITVRARSATSELTFTAPRPTTVLASAVQLFITDQHGDAEGFGVIGGPGFPEWFSPTRQRLAAGTLTESVSVWLTAPASGPAAPDTAADLYSGIFGNASGLIGSEHFALPAASLATVHAEYASDTPTTGGVSLSAYTAAALSDGGTIGLITPVSVPARVTEHLLTGPGVYWSNQYYQSQSELGGGQTDVARSFVAGSVTTQEWNVDPLNTPLDSNGAATLPPPDGGSSVSLSATRVGRTLALDLTPFTDATAGHSGTGFAQGIFGNIGAISGSYQIDDNGAKLASGKITPSTYLSSFFDDVKLPAAPSTVSFTLQAKRTGPLFPLSTQVTDTWAWRSASTPVVKVPTQWYCADGSQACAVQPLLSFGYQVAHIGLDGSTPAGTQKVQISVTHQALAPSPPAVARVTAQYSTDDGASWQPASVSGSGGTWYASFSAPSGSYVSLRVSATDAAGGALTETISRAFATETEAAAAAARRALAVRAAPAAPAAPVLDALATGAASAYHPACAPVGPSQAQCFVLFAPESAAASVGAATGAATEAAPVAAGTPAAKGKQPAGWGPRPIEAAYKLPLGRDSHALVAVVEAYDTPKLETYLNVYRRQFGLGPCTVANGCFRKVGQSGSARHLPSSGVLSGWDLEATLDVDMVSAACPSCRILVVEANGQAFSQLAAAEDTAVRLGAVAISNSYGSRETGFSQSYAKAYDHPGHAIVVSSGDYGFTAASFPANLATVTAVGGTQLSRAKDKRGWSETVWNSGEASASGCSAYVAKPSWQHDKHCQGRTVADVSALAYNIAIYNKDWGGWGLVGGTSASSPIIAGIYGLAGNATKVRPGYEYAHRKALFDVTTGNNDWFAGDNGAACGYDYLCVAKKGYDAPSGLGTPDGIGAF
jgi:hypothetical protein